MNRSCCSGDISLRFSMNFGGKPAIPRAAPSLLLLFALLGFFAGLSFAGGERDCDPLFALPQAWRTHTSPTTFPKHTRIGRRDSILLDHLAKKSSHPGKSMRKSIQRTITSLPTAARERIRNSILLRSMRRLRGKLRKPVKTRKHVVVFQYRQVLDHTEISLA